MAVLDGRNESATLGPRARRFRLAAGLTQGQLAARMQITQARVSQIESGRDPAPLPLRTLCDLADGLGVDLEALIAGDPAYEHIDLDEAVSLTPSLPASLRAVSPFIERSAEQARVLTALRDEQTRLLTLVGPAGVGKTQLALHVASLLEADIPEQAIVSLATCLDLADLLTAVARAIGLRERDARPLRQRLITALRDRRLLLLLDNVEQALPAAATLATELIAACPRLILLVTSRAPLKIRPEQTVAVPPLRLPDPERAVTLASASNAPAVQLFVQRAGVAVPGFTLTEANAVQITAICRRLDGLPLAIELAAPRMRVMTPDQLLRQLDRRLTLLTSGSRDLPARQRSLRASIAWGVDRLPSDQQALFRRLAIFADGFTLDAAIEVLCDACERTNPSPPAPCWSAADMANGIAQLLEQNLLTRSEQPDGAPRFGMLESIHEFAHEQLAAAGETAEISRRHLAWCLSLAEQAAPRMFTADEPAWLARLQQEGANLRAALGWALGPGRAGDLEAGLRLAGALCDYWYLCGLLSEGREWLTRAIGAGAGRPPSLGQARALVAAGLIEQTQAAPERATIYAAQGLAMARALDDRVTIGRALLLLGNVAMMRSNLDHAQLLHEEALACFRQLGDQSWTALTLLDLGLDCYRQDWLEPAARHANEALTLAREIGDRWDTLNALYLLGEVAWARRDLAEAEALFAEHARLSWHYGSQRDLADSLSGIGAVAITAGDLPRAARFFGAADVLYRRLDITMPPPLWPDWQALVDAIQGGIDADDFARLWSSTSPEDAMREVIDRCRPPTGDHQDRYDLSGAVSS